MGYILVILLVEMLCLYAAGQARHLIPLILFISVNMFLVSTTGARLWDFGIGVSNLGNIFYAHAAAALVMLWRFHGGPAATEAVLLVLATTSVFLLIRLLTVHANPIVPGNEEIVAAYRQVVSVQPLITVGSLLAFYCSTQFLLSVLLKTRQHSLAVGYFLGLSAMQLVDSLVFFPVAFGLDVFSIAAAKAIGMGFIIKMTILAALFPLVWLTRARREKVPALA